VRSESEANNNDKELHSNIMPIFFLMQAHTTSGFYNYVPFPLLLLYILVWDS